MGGCRTSHGRRRSRRESRQVRRAERALFPVRRASIDGVPTQIEILQTPGYLLILFERAHTYRIIPTDARPHAGPAVALWMGDSRGRWEGNTLVVDVTNHNAKTWFDQAGNFHSPAAHMIERFTLVDPDTIHYEVRIEDPRVYTRPWTMAFPLRRNKEPGFRLLEEACHEGERNTDPLIRAGQRIYPEAGSAAPESPRPTTLFPARIDLLAEQERRIRAGPRRELLRAAAVHRRGIDVAFLIHAHPVNAPEGAGEITPHAPRVEELAVEAT